MKAIDRERLKELLHYNPETGEFRWIGCYHQRLNGLVAGTLKESGYIEIKIDRRLYKAHRLAWLYTHGVWPDGELDHRDTDRSNNAIGNLRPATRSQNCSNVKLRKDNTSGVKGVSFYKPTGVWRAYINHQGVRNYLGQFSSFEEAVAARHVAVKAHGDFARLA